MTSLTNFAGRTAVITGGASGIGLALARRLGRDGANLVLADIETTALNTAVAALEADGVSVLGVPTDVGRQEAIVALADAAEERFGPIHFLHNNAGVVTTGRAEDQTDAQWEWVMNVNLNSVIWGCRTFLPRMKAHGEAAHIVNTASMAGMSGGPLMAPYFTTKFAVVGLSESLWHESQADGSNVGVSVLCPAFVRTGIAHSDRNRPEEVDNWVVGGSESAAQFAAMLDAGVEGGIEPTDVADAVVGAVAEGRLWILTHPESIEGIGLRAEAIMGGGVPVPRQLGG